MTHVGAKRSSTYQQTSQQVEELRNSLETPREIDRLFRGNWQADGKLPDVLRNRQ